MESVSMTEFIHHLSSVFVDAEPASITPAARLRELKGWDSLAALMLIALADQEFHVTLRGADIHGAVTVDDLYQRIAR